MDKPRQRRLPKTYRFSNITVEALERLSEHLKTNRTQIIEIAVSQFSQRNLDGRELS
jgi:hypothetical protein